MVSIMIKRKDEGPPWTPALIRRAIYDRHKTLKELAIENDRNPNSFRHVWKRPNQINEKIIADFLGKPVEELWPDRYPDNRMLKPR